MNENGINLLEVKEYNRALIMQLLCTNTVPTRNFLAKKSGLTKMTVTNITTELMQKGIIQEAEQSAEKKASAKQGRSPRILELAPTAPLIVGVWISKDYLFGIVTDLRLNTITASRLDFEEKETQETIGKKLVKLCKYLVEYTDRAILGIGIAAIGIIDHKNGVIEKVINFYGVKNLHIMEILQAEFKIPVYVRNDMQSAALCELYFGYGKEHRNFIYVGIDNGVGAAAVSNSKLMHSATGSFGEFGHLSIDYNGTPCDCGNRGCLELYTSCSVIVQNINIACGTSFKSFRDAMEYCELNMDAYDQLSEILHKFSFGINSMMNVLDIHKIVIGHRGYFLPDKSIDFLKARLNEISVFRDNRSIEIYPSSFTTNAPLYGSACIILNQLFTGGLSF